jgi:P-type Cu+ transporter
MKHSILAVSLAVTLTAALSAGAAKPAAKGKKPTELHCAVMKEHKVSVKEATGKKAFADYKGNRYFFCCPGCKPEFDKNPAKFAKSDHIPTPKK